MTSLPIPGLETLPWLAGGAWGVEGGRAAPLGAPLEGRRKVGCLENLLYRTGSCPIAATENKACLGRAGDLVSQPDSATVCHVTSHKSPQASLGLSFPLCEPLST